MRRKYEGKKEICFGTAALPLSMGAGCGEQKELDKMPSDYRLEQAKKTNMSP